MSCFLIINDNTIYDPYQKQFFYKLVNTTIELLIKKYKEININFLNNFSFTINTQNYRHFNIQEYIKSSYNTNFSIFDCICNNDTWNYKNIIVLTFKLNIIEKLLEIPNLTILLLNYNSQDMNNDVKDSKVIKSYRNFITKMNIKKIYKYNYNSIIDYYINSTLN